MNPETINAAIALAIKDGDVPHIDQRKIAEFFVLRKPNSLMLASPH
ncbi:hypothetical protein [Mycobacterium sp. 4858]|nr:hypothetical protein [Mycobacterium sp. 4858]